MKPFKMVLIFITIISFLATNITAAVSSSLMSYSFSVQVGRNANGNPGLSLFNNVPHHSYADSMSVTTSFMSFVQTDPSIGTYWVNNQALSEVGSISSIYATPSTTPVTCGFRLTFYGAVVNPLQWTVVSPSNQIVISSTPPTYDQATNSYLYEVTIKSGHCLLQVGESMCEVRFDIFQFTISPQDFSSYIPATDDTLNRAGRFGVKLTQIEILHPTSKAKLGNAIPVSSSNSNEPLIMFRPQTLSSEVRCQKAVTTVGTAASTMQCFLEIVAPEGLMAKNDRFTINLGLSSDISYLQSDGIKSALFDTAIANFPFLFESPNPTFSSGSAHIITVTSVTSQNCDSILELDQGRYGDCVVIRAGQDTTWAYGTRAKLSFRVNFAATPGQLNQHSIRASIQYSEPAQSQYSIAPLTATTSTTGSLYDQILLSAAPPVVSFAPQVATDIHLPQLTFGTNFSYPGGDIGPIYLSIRVHHGSDDVETPPIRFLSCQLWGLATQIQAASISFDPKAFGPASFKWTPSIEHQQASGGTVNVLCRILTIAPPSSDGYMLRISVVSGSGSSIQPWTSLGSSFSKVQIPTGYKPSYLPAAMRLTDTAALFATPSPVLKLDVGIPDLCVWRYGNYFTLTPQNTNAFPTTLTSTNFKIVGFMSNSFRCSQYLSGLIKCVAAASHPCPWDFASTTLGTDLQTVRAYVPASVPTLKIEITLNPGTTVGDYVDFSYDTTQVGYLPGVLEPGSRLWIRTQGDLTTAQSLCPIIANLDESKPSKTAISPANPNWLAKTSSTGTVLIRGEDVQFGFKIKPGYGCKTTGDDSTRSLFSSNSLYAGYLSAPTFKMIDQEKAIAAGVSAEVNLSLAGYGAILQPQDLPYLGSFVSTSTTSPLASSSFASTMWWTILPKLNKPFCTGQTTCIVSVPQLPTQDHNPIAYPQKQTPLDLTFLQAQMSLGAPLTPSLNSVDTFQINTKLYPFLDTMVFDFGHVPGLLKKQYIEDRDSVRVVIRAKAGAGKSFDILPFNVPETIISNTITAITPSGVASKDILNMPCVWQWSNKGNDGIETAVNLQLATSPSTFSSSFNLFGGDGTSDYDWNIQGQNILGVYNLPDVDIDTQITNSVRKVLKLTCYFLPDKAAQIDLSSNSDIAFGLSMEGAESFRTPFTQPFTLQNPDATQSKYLTKITSTSTTLRPLTQRIEFGSSAFQYTPLNNVSFTLSVYNPGFSFRVGDGVKIIVNNIPPWLKESVTYSTSLTSSSHTAQVLNKLKSSSSIINHPSNGSWAFAIESTIPLSILTVISAEGLWDRISFDFSFNYIQDWAQPADLNSPFLKPYYFHYESYFINLKEKFNTAFMDSIGQQLDALVPIQWDPSITPPDPNVPCPDGFYGPDCKQEAVDIPPSPDPIVTLPKPPTKLPQTTADPTGHCHVVVDVNGIYRRFNSAYATMCSIPTAGTLTTSKISHTSPLLSPEIQSQLTALWDGVTANQFNLCDCNCKGYWLDEPTTLDYKKCSKCTMPDGGCPALMTPNGECTSCECSTPLCKKMSSYLFTTLYFEPQLLKWLSDPSASTVPDELKPILTDTDLTKYVHSPTPEIKYKYTTQLKRFQTWLLTQWKDTSATTKLQSVYTSPILEGSFTSWMFTLGVANTSTAPITNLPNYGMAQFSQSLSTLFVTWIYTETGPLGANTDGINTPLGQAILSLLSTPAQTSSKVPLYTSNIMTTKCISHQDYIKSTTGSLIVTADLLHPCPASNQYIRVTDTTLSLEETNSRLAQLNPLWSTCTDTAYTQYETLLLPQPETTTISTRQIYPQCFDFTGTNLATKGVACQFTQHSILFSTERVALLNPTYISTLLSSFSPSDIPTAAKPLIDTLRSQQLTKFPHFPLTGTIMCSIPSSTPPPTPVIELNSLTATPTTLTIDAHSHMSWGYQGDDTLQVTLVMKSTQKENDGTGQFVFSQTLGTVPLSNLFSSPQVPTYTNSPLFAAIYDMLHSDNANTSFGDVYNINTGITILGYLNQDAGQTISIDQTESAAAFTFVLPMMCDQLEVSCAKDTQFCYQADARCRCKPGYREVVASTGDDQIEYPYDEDPTTAGALIDGNHLTCVPLCENQGLWDQSTGKCSCLSGTTGEHCQKITTCPHSTTCNNHGYLPSISSDACASECICTGAWINTQDSPLVEFVPVNAQCNFCPLYPYHSDYYSQTELDHIQEWHNADPTTRGTYTPDQEGKQTYISEDSQQQHCYITGTDHDAMKTQCPTKCICRKGYGGDYCQLHVAYATFPYNSVTGVNYDYDETSKSLLFSKFLEEIALSMLQFDQTNMFILDHDRFAQTITVGFYGGLDFFILNQEQQSSQSQSFFTTLSNTLFSTQQMQFGSPSPLPTNLDSLYTQWGQLQTTFPQTPISSQDSNKFLGEIQPPLDIQDPSCYEHSILGCSGEPPAKRASGKGLLIGLVVGLVGAALLFIILVSVLLWCKKNKRGLWKSKEEQDRDEMSNFVPTTRKQFNGSTNAPSMTVGTLSITPVNADGVEMSGTASASKPASSVQSVNNHKEVEDASLPTNYKAYKDAKGQIFYVDSETMTTTWHHPTKANEDAGPAGYGSGW